MTDIAAGREDMAAALRWAAKLGLNEGICNHFSIEVGTDRYLINPQGLHWSEVKAGDILLIDGGGKVLEDMAFVLTAGVVTGTFSTVYIAGSLIVDWQSWRQRWQARKKKVVAKA